MTMFLLEDRFVCLWFKFVSNCSAQGIPCAERFRINLNTTPSLVTVMGLVLPAESKQNGNSIFVEIALDRFAQFTFGFSI
jgi:hypothetical protein